jgi:hypothetical protein
MKKLLLIALVAGGLTFAGAPRSDAQVFFSVGFGYYRPHWGYSYYRPYYWHGGHRYYRHHHHRYYHRY